MDIGIPERASQAGDEREVSTTSQRSNPYPPPNAQSAEVSEFEIFFFFSPTQKTHPLPIVSRRSEGTIHPASVSKCRSVLSGGRGTHNHMVVM